MQECLRLQLEMRAPQQPSLHSVKQVREGNGEEGGGRREGNGEEGGREMVREEVCGHRNGWKRVQTYKRFIC